MFVPPNSSQTVPLPGDQAFKHMSLWGHSNSNSHRSLCLPGWLSESTIWHWQAVKIILRASYQSHGPVIPWYVSSHDSSMVPSGDFWPMLFSDIWPLPFKGTDQCSFKLPITPSKAAKYILPSFPAGILPRIPTHTPWRPLLVPSQDAQPVPFKGIQPELWQALGFMAMLG